MENKVSLYEITKDLETLIAALDNETIEDQEFMDAIETLEGMFSDKAEKIAGYMQYISGLAEQAKAESKRLSDLAKSRERKSEKLKDYILQSMIKADLKKLDTARFSFTVRNNAESVFIQDDQAVSREFVKIKTEESIDKTAIKTYYKETGIVPSGVLIQRSQSLIIK